MRIYYLFGQLLRPLMAAGFWVYNRVTQRPRSRVIVKNEYGEILLVRNWGGTRAWGLPGGGVERRERPAAAAQRELQEETGIQAPLERFHYLETLQVSYPAPIYTVTVAKAELPAQQYNPWEITHISWFGRDDLPVLSPLTQAAITLMVDRA